MSCPPRFRRSSSWTCASSCSGLGLWDESFTIESHCLLGSRKLQLKCLAVVVQPDRSAAILHRRIAPMDPTAHTILRTQDKPLAATFECVAPQHRLNCEQFEQREVSSCCLPSSSFRPARCSSRARPGQPWNPLKAIQLWFAGGDEPPVLVGGIIFNEAILPTHDLKTCLSKFTFNLLG